MLRDDEYIMQWFSLTDRSVTTKRSEVLLWNLLTENASKHFQTLQDKNQDHDPDPEKAHDHDQWS